MQLETTTLPTNPDLMRGRLGTVLTIKNGENQLVECSQFPVETDWLAISIPKEPL